MKKESAEDILNKLPKRCKPIEIWMSTNKLKFKANHLVDAIKTIESKVNSIDNMESINDYIYFSLKKK